MDIRSGLYRLARRVFTQPGVESREAVIRSLRPGFEVEALRTLLEHARTQVPYYEGLLGSRMREGYQEPSTPREETDAASLLQGIPVLTKQLIGDHGEELRSRDMDGRRCFLNSSGGSTGEPVTIVQDETFSEWGQATMNHYLRDFLSCSLESSRKVVLWGSERDILARRWNPRAWLSAWLSRTTLLNSFRTTREDLDHYVDCINRLRPEWVKGYASSLHALARHIVAHSLKVHRPRFVYSSAETLLPFMRETIEEAFGCKVHDFYGSREVGAIAGECMEGKMHIFSFNNVVEVVDEEGRPVAPGQEGRILVTTLHNRSMPLIRYDIGDMAIRGDRCPCGRDLPVLERITGRVTDNFITHRGDLVHGEYFTHLFYFRDWVREFQVLQVSHECIEICVVVRETPPKTEQKEIEGQIRAVMGPDCLVKWRFVETIPSGPQGKRCFTRSLLVSPEPESKVRAG